MGAIDNVKDIAKLVRDIGNMDLYRQILDLQGEIIDLTETNRELQRRIRELEEERSRIGTMTYRFPFYFAEGDKTPFCPRCWEVDRKAVHFPEPFRSAAGPNYTCPACKTSIIHPRN